ncbi:MAG TPA: cation:proton antiporter [Thermoplasmata archaeon]|nr:cation:proton antiporter [Thermoplasmata archaeon]
MSAPDVVALSGQLAVLFAFAALAHFVFRRLRQPVLLGEIAIGVLLGPSLLGTLTSYTFDATFIGPLAAVGSIFLLFRIGLESDFRAVYTRGNLLVALGGVLLPFAAGFAAAYLALPPEGLGPSGTQFTVSMFVGTTLVATSVAIAAAILHEVGLVRDVVARTILGAAIVDDILGLLVLSIAVGANGGGIDLVGLVILAALAVSFVVAGIFVGVHVLSRLVVRVHRAGSRLGLPHVGLVVALALAFLYALVSEALGLSAIVGAFLAGSMFAGTPLREELDDGLSYLVAIFTPIFFISLGLQVNVPGVSSGLVAFAALLLAVAIVTKVVGCAIPARLVRMTREEALAVGWGMTPRGEVGLIVALTALNAFVISDRLFSAVVLVIIAATVIPAPFFRASLARVARARSQAVPPSEAGES